MSQLLGSVLSSINSAGGPEKVLRPSIWASLVRLGTKGADRTTLSAVILLDSVNASRLSWD